MARKSTKPPIAPGNNPEISARLDRLFQPKKIEALQDAVNTVQASDAAASAALGEGILLPGGARLRWINATLFDDNPEQIRDEYPEEEVEDMRASLDAVGQLQPGIARESPDLPGRFQLAVAHMRTRGVLAGGNAGSQLPNPEQYIGKVWVIVKELTDTEMLLLAIEENEKRSNPNPIARARGYQRLHEVLGDGEQEHQAWELVAEKTKLSYRRMKQIRDLLRLPKDAQDRLKSGEWNEKHGRALLEHIDDPDRLEKLKGQMIREKLSGNKSIERSAGLREAFPTQAELALKGMVAGELGNRAKSSAAKTAEKNRAAVEQGKSHLTLVPRETSTGALPGMPGEFEQDYPSTPAEAFASAAVKIRAEVEASTAPRFPTYNIEERAVLEGLIANMAEACQLLEQHNAHRNSILIVSQARKLIASGLEDAKLRGGVK